MWSIGVSILQCGIRGVIADLGYTVSMPWFGSRRGREEEFGLAVENAAQHSGQSWLIAPLGISSSSWQATDAGKKKSVTSTAPHKGITHAFQLLADALNLVLAPGSWQSKPSYCEQPSQS